ncbi:MAG: Rrf2 family transcriptional regulator [Alphaproteobacteria bacterium]|nr:Rrf2 family transcriptional regulator [Alphaproteobacteria bacterium]
MQALPNKAYIALGAALFIAFHGGKDTPIAGTAIAEHYGLKKRALEPTLQCLGSKGILDSIRGQGGGYYMPAPENVSVADVVSCFLDDKNPCDKAFTEFAPVMMDALKPGLHDWLQAMSKISIASLCEKLDDSGVPKMGEAVLDFAI